MIDDFSTVHHRLRTEFPSALVLVHDDRTEHFEYWDENPETVDAAMLAYVQKQGFKVLDGGRKECEVTGQQQGWLEFRRHDPGEVSDGGERRC